MTADVSTIVRGAQPVSVGRGTAAQGVIRAAGRVGTRVAGALGAVATALVESAAAATFEVDESVRASRDAGGRI